MSDAEPIVFRPRADAQVQQSGEAAAGGTQQSSQSTASYVSFNRRELNEILRVYGRMVAAGEWRDYAIDMIKDRAVFSVFRRASEFPLYRIEKSPRNARKQGAYSVVAAGGLIIKRGHDLARVLAVIDRSLKLVERY